MRLLFTSAVREKLEARHEVSIREVQECFENRAGPFLYDTRIRHKTRPPTLWFIAPTDRGRLLKVVFIPTSRGKVLKSAFEPIEIERAIYARSGGR